MQFIRQQPVEKVQTGIRLLDEALKGGLRRKSLYIIAGRVGQGKTSLALSIARRMALDGRKRVLFVSLEMDKDELMERLVCQHTLHTPETLVAFRESQELETVAKPFLSVCKESIFHLVDDRGETIDDLGLLLDELRYSQEPMYDVVFVDHLQHATFTAGESLPEAIGIYLKRLKSLAKKKNMIVILCSQLNRGVYDQKEQKAQLHNLKGSGSIEEIADSVWLCGMKPTEPGQTPPQDLEYKIMIAKHRRGPQSEITLHYRAECYEFLEPSQQLTPKLEI